MTAKDGIFSSSQGVRYENNLRTHYRQSFAKALGAIADTRLNVEKYSSEHGVIDGRANFIDGAYLDFSEEILLVEKTFTKKRYRYEYVKNKQEVFRYDNFPKHPGIRPPYHHKHVSKRRALQIKAAPKRIDVLRVEKILSPRRCGMSRRITTTMMSGSK